MVKCSSCGVENPSSAGYCLKCGATLASDSKALEQPMPAKQFVAVQAQSTLSKMLETPGTMVLTMGLAILFVSILVGALGHWVAAVALFAVSIVLLLVALELRRHEAKAAVPRTEIREREIVKVKCRYCGALNPDGATNCGSCGAQL